MASSSDDEHDTPVADAPVADVNAAVQSMLQQINALAARMAATQALLGQSLAASPYRVERSGAVPAGTPAGLASRDHIEPARVALGPMPHRMPVAAPQPSLAVHAGSRAATGRQAMEGGTAGAVAVDSEALHLLRSMVQKQAPPTWDGEPATCEEFFFRIRMHLDAVDPHGVLAMHHPAGEVIFTSSRFTGDASAWYRTLVGCGQQPRTFDALLAVAKQHFRPELSKTRVLDRLMALTQTGMLHEYIVEFNTLTMHLLDLSDDMRLYFFMRGLHPDLAARMVGTRVRTVDAAIELASRIEDHFYGASGEDDSPQVDEGRVLARHHRSAA